MEDTAKQQDFLIIIPSFNEEKTILSVVSGVRKLYPDTQVLVVDDGSQDNTALLARNAGAVVLSHPFNMGYGVCLQTGYKYALCNNYQYAVQMDGDGQHDPEGLKVLLENIKDGSCDIVLGSRFMGVNRYRLSVWRRLGIEFFKIILRLFTAKYISDPTTGFQAMNRKTLNLFAHDFFPYDYPDADVIVLLSKADFKIKEVSVPMYPSKTGKSMHKRPLSAVYYIFKMLLSMFVTRLRRYDIEGLI